MISSFGLTSLGLLLTYIIDHLFSTTFLHPPPHGSNVEGLGGAIRNFLKKFSVFIIVVGPDGKSVMFNLTHGGMTAPTNYMQRMKTLCTSMVGIMK